MCISHRLQCKIKSKINPVWIKILKIPTVDNFHLINSSKWYHVYKNPTIHILDMKYGHYGSNTLSVYMTLLWQHVIYVFRMLTWCVLISYDSRLYPFHILIFYNAMTLQARNYNSKPTEDLSNRTDIFVIPPQWLEWQCNDLMSRVTGFESHCKTWVPMRPYKPRSRVTVSVA
jgi:hypothetical protein